MTRNGNTYDVIVVGAGPGGSAAAYFAAMAGLEVLLIDKEDFPRPKVCSGGLSPKSLAVLEKMDVLEEIKHSGRPMIRTLKLGSPSGLILEGDIPVTSISQGFGYVVPRFQLDDMVRWRALKAGTVFKKGRVNQLLYSDGNVSGVLMNNQKIKADLIIIASGAIRLASLCDIAPRISDDAVFFATQAHYNEAGRNPTTMEIYFEQSLLPGYFWIFPQGDGKSTVGAGVWGNPGGASALQERYEAGVRYINNVCHELLPPSDTLKFENWIIPAERNIRPVIAPNVLLVGDAGGFANPFTGEGIYYALETGRLAGEVAADNLKKNNPWSIAEDYEAQLFGVLADLRASWLFHDLMSDSSLADHVIREASRNESLKTELVGAVLNASDKHGLMGWLESMRESSA